MSVDETTSTDGAVAVPELGQAVFGAPMAEFEPPEIAEAAMRSVLEELERVHGNREQTRDIRFGGNEGNEYELGEIRYKAYDWGDCDCDTVGECLGKCEWSKPNFSYGGVEWRWYKYFGRGDSVNVNWSPSQWSDWLIKTLAYIRSFDSALLAVPPNPHQKANDGEKRRREDLAND